MKIILIEDFFTKKYTGFLDEHPELIIQCDNPEEVHEKMKALGQIFLNVFLSDGDFDKSKAMLAIKDTDKFELQIYSTKDQLNLLKQKLSNFK